MSVLSLLPSFRVSASLLILFFFPFPLSFCLYTHPPSLPSLLLRELLSSLPPFLTPSILPSFPYSSPSAPQHLFSLCPYFFSHLHPTSLLSHAPLCRPSFYPPILALTSATFTTSFPLSLLSLTFSSLHFSSSSPLLHLKVEFFCVNRIKHDTII